MKHYGFPLSLLLILVFACTGTKNTSLKKGKTATLDTIWQAPDYPIGTCWKTELVSVSKRLPNATPSVNKVSLEIQKSVETEYGDAFQGVMDIPRDRKRTTVTILKEHLTIIDPITAKGDTIRREMELVNFPLYVGKEWTSTWVFQEFADSPVTETALYFEVVRKEPFDYIKDEHLAVENHAFVISMSDRQHRPVYYHYVPAQGDFPGSSVFDIWEEMEKSGGSASLHYSCQVTDYCAN